MKLLLMVPVTSFVKLPPVFPVLVIRIYTNAVKKGVYCLSEERKYLSPDYS
jgi:hypothetical protein